MCVFVYTYSLFSYSFIICLFIHYVFILFIYLFIGILCFLNVYYLFIYLFLFIYIYHIHFMCSHIEIDTYLFTCLLISIIFVNISMYKNISTLWHIVVYMHGITYMSPCQKGSSGTFPVAHPSFQESDRFPVKVRKYTCWMFTTGCSYF